MVSPRSRRSPARPRANQQSAGTSFIARSAYAAHCAKRARSRRASDARLSRVVVHGETVYLAGTTSHAGPDIATQTADVLRKIDELLASAGRT